MRYCSSSKISFSDRRLFMQGKSYATIEKWLLFLIIICMPLSDVAQKYKLPIIGTNLTALFLWLAVLVLILWYKRDGISAIPQRKYIVLFCAWTLLCTFIGAYQFPFWNDADNAYLRSTAMVKLAARIWPTLLYSDAFLHGKYLVSCLWRLLNNTLLPLVGIFLVIHKLYGENPQKGMEWISKAAKTMVILMGIYSAFEICWLWTGNPTCAKILASINCQIYEPVHSNGWWPPLLWDGQLRSYTQEPSFFGIIAAFLMPFMWWLFFQYGKKSDLVLLVYFTFMIFMTKARTATIIYLCEASLFIFLCLINHFKRWRKEIFKIVTITLFSFMVYIVSNIYVPSLLANMDSIGYLSISRVTEQSQKYVKSNIISVASVTQRSNTARMGSTLAMAKVGLKYPVFGVGYGYMDMYVMHQLPDFTMASSEIQLWTNDILNSTFMQARYPIVNTLSAVIAQYGVPGLILFCAPLIYVAIFLSKNRRLVVK